MKGHCPVNASCASGLLSKLCSLFDIGVIGTILGLYGDNGKENGNYYIGVTYHISSFLGTLHIRCRIIIGIQKGTIILTTTQVVYQLLVAPKP